MLLSIRELLMYQVQCSAFYMLYVIKHNTDNSKIFGGENVSPKISVESLITPNITPFNIGRLMSLGLNNLT